MICNTNENLSLFKINLIKHLFLNFIIKVQADFLSASVIGGNRSVYKH